MSVTLDQVPDWKPDKLASASGFNTVKRAVQAQRRSLLAQGIMDSTGTYSAALRANETAGRQFRFKSIADDHIVCRTWDGATEGGADVLVAKPPVLRGDGETRTVNGEDQDVFPPYAVNDLIYAIKPRGGTGLSSVLWQDINVDARRWSAVCT